MTFYLSQWQGTGTRTDPFVPVGRPTSGLWQCIDLRADSTVTDGYALLWTETALSPVPVGVWLLADTADSELAGNVRAQWSQLLGVSTFPNKTTFREAVHRTMTTDATGPTNGKWAAVRASVTGDYRIVLGDLVDTWAE